MENIKTTHGGAGRGQGRKKKETPRFKFQIIAYKETIQAIKNLKAHCAEMDKDFVTELNYRFFNSLKINKIGDDEK